MQKQPETSAFSQAEKIACDKAFYLPVILTAILSYGYTLTHFVPGIDDLAANFYLKRGLLAQGRFTNTLLACITGFWESYPFVQDFLAVLFFLAAAVLMCAVFQTVAGGKIKTGALTAFACVFVSCPLICEIFMFCGASFNCGVSFFFTALAVWLGYRGITEKRFSRIALSALIMFFIASLYEAFFSVFAADVFFIFILDYMYAAKGNRKLSLYVKRGLILLAVLVAAILIEYVVSGAIIKLMKLDDTTYMQENITPKYFTEGFLGTFVIMVKQVLLHQLSGLWNFPVAIMNVSLLIIVVLGIIALIKTKKLTLPLLYFGVFFCAFAMSVLQGTQAKSRTLEAVFVINAFAIMQVVQLTLKSGKTGLKRLACAAVCILVVWQSGYMTKLFYYEQLKFDAECRKITQIYSAVEEKYPNNTKPVVWVGNAGLNDSLLKMVYITSDSAGYRFANKLAGGRLDSVYGADETKYITPRCAVLARSYFDWSINGLRESNTELHTYFEYLGLDYTPVEKEIYEQAVEKAADMPAWNAPGCILQTDEYIVVKTGATG